LLEYLGEGVKRCALKQLFAGALDPHVWIVPDARTEFPDQARFSDSRLARDHYQLALAFPHPRLRSN
jgi:hypothetical protein